MTDKYEDPQVELEEVEKSEVEKERLEKEKAEAVEIARRAYERYFGNKN